MTSWCARWTGSSSCMPTTSRTRRPPPCACAARRAPIPMPASPQASPPSGARRTAARTKPMRETCHDVLEELGLHNDRLFKLALELERIALEDDYFVQRKLYPNV